MKNLHTAFIVKLLLMHSNRIATKYYTESTYVEEYLHEKIIIINNMFMGQVHNLHNIYLYNKFHQQQQLHNENSLNV